MTDRGAAAMVDFHSHLVPGVDDGAADLEQTRAALDTFRRQGVLTVVTTPHLRGSLTLRPAVLEAELARVDAAWEAVRTLCAAEFPEMRVERGMEVMLDVPRPDLSDPRVRLAGTRFVLLEFAAMSLPPNAGAALRGIAEAGWTPVVAHPERYANLHPSLREAEAWVGDGAALQVNGGSLLGVYGGRSKAVAWDLLDRGMAHYLCSDYHARGRCWAEQARTVLERAGAGEQARLLTETNPARLLRGEPPFPVPPLPERTRWWGRFFGRGRR